MAKPVLYTQADCAESAKVRSWLAGHGISVTERDAGNDSEAAQSLAKTGAFATPLLVVGEQKVLGFQPEALADLFDEQDEPIPAAPTPG